MRGRFLSKRMPRRAKRARHTRRRCLLAPIFLAALLSLVLIVSVTPGCAPSEDLFRTGRDAREFNPATGRYEWPRGT